MVSPKPTIDGVTHLQTFLPYADFAASAAALDWRRLGKQRVENLQIMQTLLGERVITHEIIDTGETELILYDDGTWEREPIKKRIDWPKEKWYIETYDPKGWVNHPAVRMWAGHTDVLLEYQMAICNEWTGRKYKDSCYEKTFYVRNNGASIEDSVPPWLGDTQFHRSHQSNLVRKDREFYAPKFPGVPDDLEYVWPV